MIQAYIQRVVAGESLSEADAAAAMGAIMGGEATPAQIGAFLTALRMKGETVDEVVGFVRVMREKATPIRASRTPLVDTCGTGGDHSGTFNISTAAAFVVAGTGVAVAKHGNRAATSQSGSADVLRALGVNVEANPEVVARCIDEAGIGFLFAVALHGAMKHAIGPRREIGIRTVFNILGPMTNPAGAKHQLIGVFSADWVEPIAQTLRKLGTAHALVVHGNDGLDEITTTAPSLIAELRGGSVSINEFDPLDLGIARAEPDALKGGTPDENAAALRALLSGEPGALRDVVVLNAAGALIAADAANDWRDGLAQAKESIDSGAALARLNNLVRVSGEAHR
ncbi:anthranilate phosphoribosyltransferase [Candidatus Poribacteria bacterium]|nr:anthranilate phosphoribosyltransferase [Candidatus Poribacteria bacterium]